MSGDNLTIATFFVGLAVTLIGLGISQAGWKHPALIYGVFILGFICLGLGAFWDTIKTISPAPFVFSIEEIATNPESWFFLFVLIIVSLFLPTHPKIASSPKTEKIEPTKIIQKEPESTTDSQKVIETKERIYTEKTPFDLVEIYRSHTNIQSIPLISPFLGVWIKAYGNCFSVRDQKTHFSVTLYPDGSLLVLQCYFSPSWKDALMRIQKGDLVHIIGKIKEIDYDLTLSDCELINLLALPRATQELPKPLSET